MATVRNFETSQDMPDKFNEAKTCTQVLKPTNSRYNNSNNNHNNTQIKKTELNSTQPNEHLLAVAWIQLGGPGNLL
jgi:hypothetical protein